MSTKMSLVLGLWLVCGFFANLPTASSIQCYKCADWPGTKIPCKGSSAIQCKSYSDSCGTMKIKVERFGIHSDLTLKYCSIARSFDCNQTYICELLNKSVVAVGGKLFQCDGSCCHTYRCNGQDEGGLSYFIELVRALLDEMEYIVDNVLLSATEYKERVMEVLNDFYAAITNEEGQKSNSITDELKTNAELMKKLETKRGQSKKELSAMPLRRKKREDKTYQLRE